MATRSFAAAAALVLLVGCSLPPPVPANVSPIPEESSYEQVNQHTGIKIFPPTAGNIKYSLEGFVDVEEYFYLKDGRESVDQISLTLLGFVPDEYGYRMKSRGNSSRSWWFKETPRGSRGGQLDRSPQFVEILILDHPTYSEMWIYKSQAY